MHSRRSPIARRRVHPGREETSSTAPPFGVTHRLARMSPLRRLAALAARTPSSCATKSFRTGYATTPSTPGIYEFRTYDIQPGALGDYLALCDASRATRQRLNPGFLGFFQTETGGDVNRVTHVYRYENYDERDRVRGVMARDAEWVNFLRESKSALRSQTSEIFLEAAKATTAAGLGVNDMVRRAAQDGARAPGVFELRRYQLELGYNPIPKLIDHLASGLPSKIQSDKDKKGELCGMFYSDVGKLNQFVELWRYDSYQDHIRVREAARGASAWRAAIGEIAPMVQMFDTQLLKPVGLSPIQ
jgi:hypothetical protein|mmetsp:Transcript_2706/g.8796  ORF Transcript_2706/g.8796 Transcript_2706/m.8796 type:complete len:303 (-) Transcript_2706:3373-4281(-)